ncbi:hypothetical protein CPC08DRAFT_709608 [Agrocybe pediades]|nr:hypothetical protein CPC08DRAFT_709608 [Agrocybe pediades]
MSRNRNQMPLHFNQSVPVMQRRLRMPRRRWGGVVLDARIRTTRPRRIGCIFVPIASSSFKFEKFHSKKDKDGTALRLDRLYNQLYSK